jgi:hypothetical protein
MAIGNRKSVALLLGALLGSCTHEEAVRRPEVFTVMCPKDRMTVTNMADWTAHTKFGCDKNGYITRSTD